MVANAAQFRHGGEPMSSFVTSRSLSGAAVESLKPHDPM